MRKILPKVTIAILTVMAVLVVVRFASQRDESELAKDEGAVKVGSQSHQKVRASSEGRNDVTSPDNSKVQGGASGSKLSQISEKTAAPPFSFVKRGNDTASDPLLELGLALTPRKAHPPKELSVPRGTRHRIEVKFVDEVVARLTADNQVSVSNMSGDDMAELVQLSSRNDLVFRKAFPFPDQIEELRKSAAIRSGKMQADLNGTMHVHINTSENLLEIANVLQNSPLIESVDIESLDLPPPPPVDISPTTPSLVSQQTYRNTDPGFGVDSLWNLGVKGEGVKFTDCEYGFNPDHEDLGDSGITDLSPAAVNSQVYTNGWDEHGTAAMGVTGATHNDYGVSGIAPDADLQFSSEWTVLGYNRTQAIVEAVANSNAGDVILLEMQATGAQGDFGPAEYQSSVWNITRTAADAGIIVVAAAGNGSEDLDSNEYAAYRARGDSGAIIVGAGSSNSNHTKLSYSTFGTRVDVQAWGNSVLTTGYGGFAKYGGDDNQSYSNFSGTSSASACVGGLATLMQSYAKNVLQTTLTPIEMRSHLKANGNPQTGSGGNIGDGVALDLAVAAIPEDPGSITIEKSAGLEKLRYFMLPFRNYKIEVSDDQSTWSNFQTGIDGGVGTGEFDLTSQISASEQRYYRIAED